LASEKDRSAARILAGLATSEVSHEARPEAATVLTRWLGRGRWNRARERTSRQELRTPWRDTRSANRLGWRERAAYLDGNQVFAVDYETCHQCRLGWVEEPYTDPEFQRCGLAAAALAALRHENPGLEWHTLGGHFRETEPFWAAAGEGVPGGYAERGVCSHRKIG
jgi:hypothetical protein